MTDSMWFLLAGAGLTLLSLNIVRVVSAERLALFSTRRRHSSQLVSRGTFVEGRRHSDVALALTDSAFIYENSNMSNSLDRNWILGVEYKTELSTGQRVVAGKVLMIHCFSKIFEFVLPWDVVREWETLLPARQ